MAAGLFELRKDAITGWWVATVVDRPFHRDRFALAGRARRRRRRLPELPAAGGRRGPASGRSRTSHSTSSGPRTTPASSTEPRPGRARAGARRRAAGGPSSRRRGEHRPLQPSAARSSARCSGSCRTRSPRPRRPARRTTSRSSRTGAPRPVPGRTTCASTCTTCPRSRIASPRSSAAPPASSSARGSARAAAWSATSRAVGERLVWEDEATRGLRAVRVAVAVRGLGRAAPPRRPTSARPPTPTSLRRPRRCARSSAGSPRASTARPTTSSSTPPRSASGSTRPTTGTGRSTRACARSPASSSGRDCRSTRSRPEDAVEELLGGTRRSRASRSDGLMIGRAEPASHAADASSSRPRARAPAGAQPSVARRIHGRALDRDRAATLRGAADDGAWDQDAARAFVEDLFARHHGEIYAYLIRMVRDPELAADLTQDAFVKAYRDLRHARGSRERPSVAVPDRPPRRPRRVPPPEDRPVHAVDRRVARRGAIGRAPRDGRPAVRRPPAGPRPDPRAPASRPAAGRAARPDRPRARGRARVSHVAARALLTRARESLRQALAAEREAEAEAEARTAAQVTPPTRSIRDGPLMDRRHNDPQTPHERARVLASDRLDGPLDAEDAVWLDGHLAGCDECRSIAAAYAADRELLRRCRCPSHPATCGRGRRWRSSANAPVDPMRSLPRRASGSAGRRSPGPWRSCSWASSPVEPSSRRRTPGWRSPGARRRTAARALTRRHWRSPPATSPGPPRAPMAPIP